MRELNLTGGFSADSGPSGICVLEATCARKSLHMQNPLRIGPTKAPGESRHLSIAKPWAVSLNLNS